MVLEKTLERPWTEGGQTGQSKRKSTTLILIEKTDAEAELLLWPFDAYKLSWKRPDAGKDEGKGRKEVMAEDEVVGMY